MTKNNKIILNRIKHEIFMLEQFKKDKNNIPSFWSVKQQDAFIKGMQFVYQIIDNPELFNDDSIEPNK